MRPHRAISAKMRCGLLLSLLFVLGGCLGANRSPVADQPGMEATTSTWALNFSDLAVGKEWVLVEVTPRAPVPLMAQFRFDFVLRGPVQGADDHLAEAKNFCGVAGGIGTQAITGAFSSSAGVRYNEHGRHYYGPYGASFDARGSIPVANGEGAYGLILFGVDDLRQWTSGLEATMRLERAGKPEAVIDFRWRVIASGELDCRQGLAEFERGTFVEAAGVMHAKDLQVALNVNSSLMGWFLGGSNLGYQVELASPAGKEFVATASTSDGSRAFSKMFVGAHPGRWVAKIANMNGTTVNAPRPTATLIAIQDLPTAALARLVGETQPAVPKSLAALAQGMA